MSASDIHFEGWPAIIILLIAGYGFGALLSQLLDWWRWWW
jgi:hypothetical protein